MLCFSTPNLFSPSPTQIAWNTSDMSVLLVLGMYKLKHLDKSLTWERNCHLDLEFPPKQWIRTAQGLFGFVCLMSRIAFFYLCQSKCCLVTSCRVWGLNHVLSTEIERERIRCRRIERKRHGKWKRKKEKTSKLRFRGNCDFCERWELGYRNRLLCF